MNYIFHSSAIKYPNYYITIWLHILALIGLIAAAGPAAAGTVKGEHHLYRPAEGPATAVSVNPNSLPSDQDDQPLLVLVDVPVLEEAGRKPEKKEETIEPVTRKLPIWGEQARQRGYDLPLPFGMGFNFTYVDQGIKIRNLKIGIGSPDIEVEGLDFKDARSHDSAITARFDMWLLPFVNIYGLFGSISGQAEFDLDVSQVASGLPPPGLPPVFEPNKTIDLNMDYSGVTFGGGMTLAIGYEKFFGSLDTNYTYSYVDNLDGKIDTLTISPRIGLLAEHPDIKGTFAFWIGAMYLHYKQTVTDDIKLDELDPRLPPVKLAFKLDVENRDPWTFLFGGQWEITKRMQFMVEGGVGERYQVTTGISFRF